MTEIFPLVGFHTKMSRNNMIRAQHAFTLIEAGITLFLIGILLAMAFPALNHFIDRTQDELVQSQLLHAIAFAREEAQMRHVATVLCQSEDHVHCNAQATESFIVFISDNEEGVLRDKNQLLAVMQRTSQRGKLYWRTFPFYRDYLLFSGSDRQTDNGTFWYCRAATKRLAWAIVLNQAGRARVIYPNKAGEITDAHGKQLQC